MDILQVLLCEVVPFVYWQALQQHIFVRVVNQRRMVYIAGVAANGPKKSFAMIAKQARRGRRMFERTRRKQCLPEGHEAVLPALLVANLQRS